MNERMLRLYDVDLSGVFWLFKNVYELDDRSAGQVTPGWQGRNRVACGAFGWYAVDSGYEYFVWL